MADSYQLKALLSAVDKITPVIREVAKNARKYLGDVGKSISIFSGKIGLPISALSGLATGFGIVKIKSAMQGYAEAGEAIYKGSLKAGLSVEAYQRLRYVAEQSGVSAETMEGAMGRLNKTIGLAAVGKSKDAAALFRRLHVNLRDANGQIRDSGQLLPELSEAFVRNVNPVVRARMGFTLYGKQWADFIPLMLEGRDGIEELSDRFLKLKSAISPQAAKQAKEWGDKLHDLDIVTKGFQNTIAAQLVPVLTPLLDDFILWAAENKKLISSKVKEFIKDLVKAVKEFDWRGLADGIKEIVRGMGWFVDHVGGVKNALIALVVFMNMSTIMAFIEMGSAVSKAAWFLGGPLAKALLWISRLFLANPWVLAITALVVGAVLVYENWDKIKSWFKGFFDWVGGKWEQFTGWIRESVAAAKDFLGLGVGSGPNAGHGATGTWAGPDTSRQLVTPRGGQISGAVSVVFDNAPPGMKVSNTSASAGLALDASVGYRSFTLGGAY